MEQIDEVGHWAVVEVREPYARIRNVVTGMWCVIWFRVWDHAVWIGLPPCPHLTYVESAMAVMGGKVLENEEAERARIVEERKRDFPSGTWSEEGFDRVAGEYPEDYARRVFAWLADPEPDPGYAWRYNHPAKNAYVNLLRREWHESLRERFARDEAEIREDPSRRWDLERKETEDRAAWWEPRMGRFEHQLNLVRRGGLNNYPWS